MRRGVNVSVFLQDLNTLPSVEEQNDPFDPEDLDLWTNTEFFDFDMGGQIMHEQSESPREQKPIASNAPTATIDPTLSDNFLNEFEEFENFEYSPTFAFPAQPVSAPLSAPSQPATAAAQTQDQKPLAAAPAASAFPSETTSPAPASTTAATPRGSKRKASVSVAASSPGSQFDHSEDPSRVAAEEDKRRRNTAASARFRVKKKQKEQQLEKTAKEMTDRVQQLESRIQQLELENKWLKGLIVEKNGGKSGEEMLMPPSILTGSKDGVGTQDATTAAKEE